MIAVDSDDSPTAAFEGVRRQIVELGDFPVPTSPFAIASANGLPDIVVMLMPFKGTGCLETICREAAYSKWANLKPAIEGLVTARGVESWPQCNRAKMEVRCLIATTCRKQPDVSLQDHWQRNEEFHIPVDHPVFDEIANLFPLIILPRACTRGRSSDRVEKQKDASSSPPARSGFRLRSRFGPIAGRSLRRRWF